MHGTHHSRKTVAEMRETGLWATRAEVRREKGQLDVHLERNETRFEIVTHIANASGMWLSDTLN